MFLHYFSFHIITIHLSKEKSCQLKLTGMNFTKVNKCSVEKNMTTQVNIIIGSCVLQLELMHMPKQ